MPPASKTGVTTFSTPSDTEFRATRIFDAPRRLVWAAYTDPKHIPNWCLGPEGWTMPVCEVDLRVGGRWTFTWRKADGAEMTMTGTYTEVRPPERLVSTESWGGPWPATVNTIEFAEHGGQTTVSLTVRYPSREARDAAAATGMKTGLDRSFQLLAAVIAALS